MTHFRKLLVLLVTIATLSIGHAQFGGPPAYTVSIKEVDKGSKDHVSIAVTFDLPKGIHVYTTADQFFKFNVSESIGLGKPKLELPELKSYTDLNGDTSDVLFGKKAVRITLPYTGPAGSTWKLVATMGSQGCDDLTCFPPQEEPVSLSGTIPEGAVIVKEEPVTKAEVNESQPPDVTPTVTEETANVDNLGFSYEMNGGSSSGGSGILVILKYMIFAFIGGLILNFMPCVLPVLSIKAMSIVNSAHQDRKEIFKGAMAYTAGVLVTFIGLATLIIVAKESGKSAGWGDHMQSPTFVIILFIIIWVFSLSLFDVFIIQLPGMQVASTASSSGGHKGSFFSGVFAVLLSTPCTAPMLGSAVGFMFAQPSYLVMISFILIGLGLAFPFILLGLSPKAMKFIPKPGAWMNTFKEVMAFLLIATAVFLLTILHSLLADNFLKFLIFILPLSVACWFYGKYAGPGNSGAKQWFSTLIAVGILAASAYAFIDIPDKLPADVRDQQVGGWYKLSDELVDKARAEGRPLLVDYNSTWSANKGSVDLTASVQELMKKHGAIVARTESNWKPLNADRLKQALLEDKRMVFIDFGADWCATCKFNEKTVLFTEGMQKEFEKRNVVLMKGDFTKKDPEINKWLMKFGRAGVPLYVIFKPGKTITAQVLPETITKGMVLNALDGK